MCVNCLECGNYSGQKVHYYFIILWYILEPIHNRFIILVFPNITVEAEMSPMVTLYHEGTKRLSIMFCILTLP